MGFEEGGAEEGREEFVRAVRGMRNSVRLQYKEEGEEGAYGVSLKAPFFCFPSGLRTAIVITTSSGFFTCSAATPVGACVKCAVSCLILSMFSSFSWCSGKKWGKRRSR